MTPALEYLRAVVGGLASRIWRTLRGGPCPCGCCRAHRDFYLKTSTAYDREVRGQGAAVTRIVLDETHYFTGERQALLDTLAEVRERRGK